MTKAVNYTKGPRKGAIRLIVIHTMESQEKPDTAESVAAWFCDPKRAPQSSAHYCVDSNSAVQIVDDQDIAWGAPGANNDGLHIELAGTASQSAKDWADAYSLAELNQAAKVAAAWCKKYSIPAVHLSVAQVADGKTKGIIGHVDATKAFPKMGGNHTDPGANFPWAVFIAKVAALLNK